MWEEVRKYYSRGENRDHQHDMYDSGDVAYRWWQNARKNTIRGLIRQQGDHTSILDVGCAEGTYLTFASNYSCKVGCDLSISKLRRGRHREADDSSDYVSADGSHLPFREGAFTIVICIDTIRYIPYPTTCLEELFRVANNSVIVQTMTDFLRLSSFPVKRPLSKIKKEMNSKEFSGAFWIFSPRSVEYMAELAKTHGFKIKMTVGLLPLANILRLLKIGENNFRKLAPLIEKIQFRFGKKFPFRLFSIFVTSEFSVHDDVNHN
ncbi:MAG: class I SAM-dependent methyltransferase [Nitrososphaerota archaeon]|jgi:ubiquinone/menaquinone biosynthesis C-methylase UbiE|nr:class I SAM-dependent methyltransferase [Nitrososphaerota archaeon]MDG6923653.1 class I SAM-dependent methyltransferase [Nitrososphaerota archaeon]